MHNLRAAFAGPSVRDRWQFCRLGGDKTGDDRFREWFVPLADGLYDEHLKELKEEGLSE